MTPLEFKDLLDKYSRGECTKAEENLVLQWYANIDSGQQNELTEDEHRAIAAKLWSELDPQRKKSRPSASRTIYRIAAAITVIALVAASLLFFEDFFKRQSTRVAAGESLKSFEKMKHIKNATNEVLNIELEDGSHVVLRPQSEIRYPVFFVQDKREVYLTGEAFFRVKRDTLHPFLVYSNEVVTKVLGTSFSVRAYKDDKEVTVAVKCGKVSVSKRNDEGRSDAEIREEEEVILVPNQQAVYHRSNALVTKQLVEIPEIILPKPTLFEMQYDGAPVVKIFRVLEENYGIDIVYDEQALKGCNLTTSMSDEGLYERIKIICEAIGAEYAVEDTRIVIKSAGC